MTPTLYLLLNAPGSDEIWFEGLLRWLLEGSPRGWNGSERTRRLEALNRALAEDPGGPGWRARIRAVWGHTSAVRLLADTGLPAHTAFLREALHRLVERFVPRLDPEADLSALLHRVDLAERDADWMEALDPALARPWLDLLALPGEALWDAAQLLAYRAAALGLARDLLGLGPDERELDSPFSRLPEAVAGLRRECGDAAPPGPDGTAPFQGGLAVVLADCRARLELALASLDRHGVSSELVFRLDLLEAHLRRMEELVCLATDRLDGRAFAATLVRQEAQHRGLGSLVRATTRRLARKVVEHTGQTGEHYIALTRPEWLRTFWSAAGGGVLTAFTAALKFRLAAAALAPMVAGLALAGNYTLSFWIMQFAGLTLASKQPAMTAASLAGALEAGRDGEALVDLAAGITRSQVMATLGNVLWTLPAAMLLGLAWQKLGGGPPLDGAALRHGLNGLHPFRSLTIPFAALTGVFLWLASLAGGWAANWSAYRRLPQALARHRRMVYWLGPERALAVAAGVERHLGGVVGYLALGFLLGFLPVAFAFAGLPLEVRHVTLQAASLALCAAQLLAGPGPVPWADLAWGLGGIAAIGVCNFGVSFLLALRTAVDARGLDRPGRAGLHRVLGRAFRERPWRFLGPPPATETQSVEKKQPRIDKI
jgi:site-specific recombinase